MEEIHRNEIEERGHHGEKKARCDDILWREVVETRGRAHHGLIAVQRVERNGYAGRLAGSAPNLILFPPFFGSGNDNTNYIQKIHSVALLFCCPIQIRRHSFVILIQ